MKNLKQILTVCITLIMFSCNAQNNENESINNVLIEFSKSSDQNNVKKLENYLDENYRIILNRAFGSEMVSIVSKESYLEKIESKEWGGDKREVKIENLQINGTTANAKVTFTGKKSTIISFITLVKNKDNEWKIVSDVPTIK